MYSYEDHLTSQSLDVVEHCRVIDDTQLDLVHMLDQGGIVPQGEGLRRGFPDGLRQNGREPRREFEPH